MNPIDHIVFIDGYCTICNNWVRFLSKRDKKRILRFTSIQGKTALSFLTQDEISSLSTIIYMKSGKKYYRSGAALRMISELGGVWSLMKVLLIIPEFMRNWIYSYVAAHRYRWYAKRTSCEIDHTIPNDIILP
ncbi:MAG: DCC1-like thiol-disulfide oxidoreductase family protein [Flavobacteriales bacterium]|nr:DCC1-like thiol-disulfide oxidoreductase family protein [Flavobacteriales bacterium]